VTHATCQSCGSPHPLFYLMEAGGKRKLSYRCHKAMKPYVGRNGVMAPRFYTQVFKAEKQIEGLPVPLEYSTGYSREVQGKMELQLPLMVTGGNKKK
jgi:hypothetical protein